MPFPFRPVLSLALLVALPLGTPPSSADEREINNRYVDQETAIREGGVSNYILPGDKPPAPSPAPLAAQAQAQPEPKPQPPEAAAAPIPRESVVHFDSGEAKLNPDAKEELLSLAEALKSDPSQQVMIDGYTDDSGPESINQVLSMKRAETAAQALIDAGVPPEQVLIAGHSAESPVSTNDTAEGRMQNRRAEIRIQQQTTG